MQQLHWVTAPPFVKLVDDDAGERRHEREDVRTLAFKPATVPAHSARDHRYTKYELTLKGWSE
jgi:hypothetical protein